MADTVWITRHGNRQDFVDPEWPLTAERPHDPGLSPDGIEQARNVAVRLLNENIGAILSSPYLRTVQTAHEVAELMDLPIYLEYGMGEWLNPTWFPAEPERMELDALQERFPRIDFSHSSLLVPEYPETEAEALERAGETVRRAAEHFDGTILLVGHGASVSGGAQGLVPHVKVDRCPLCSLFRADRSADGWELTLAADVEHLDAALAADRFN